MRIAVVDIQGFIIDEVFYPKEVAIQIGGIKSNFLFKPPKPFLELTAKDKKTTRYLEKFVHGIRYDSGDVDYSDVNVILEKHLLGNVDLIYVRGNQKIDFLKAKCEELGLHVLIYDVANYDGTACATEKFVAVYSGCPHHANGKFMCAYNNIFTLYNWLYYTVLPK